MSYHLASIYDYLANKKMHSINKFYDIDGSTRQLDSRERNQINKFMLTIKNLSTIYEPVINPIKNIKPGDIIIRRGSGEGHVMMVVEQSSFDPYLITILELTSGKGNGFNWTQKRLAKENKIYRVLRIE